MQIKKVIVIKSLFCMIFAFMSLEVSAQQSDIETLSADKALEIATEGTAQSETARENKIRQPFSWENMGDVLKYEILIEMWNKETGDFEECYSHETDENETEICTVYIDPVLPVGKYRSTVKVYNILGILEEDLTAHDEFIVRKAYKPEIKSVNYPLYMRKAIYLDDLDNNGIINIEGKNLFLPEDKDNFETVTKYFLQGKRIIYPSSVLNHDEKNKNITLQFDMKKLDVGNYHLVAKDASGLHSEENSDSEFIVKFKKWMDLDIEAGYTCPVIVHDDTIPTYFDKVLPMSAQAKVSFMPFKHSWGYLGIGLRGSYTRLYKDEGDYSIDGNMGTGHLLFVYQIPMFRRRFFTELHGGAGLTYFNNIVFHFPHNVDSEPLNTVSLSFDAGLSFMFYINKRVYFETAGDYVFTMNKDMKMGMIQPSLGLGWQF